MECLRCGAKLKDSALVCNKCGFIVKGAKKLENDEPAVSFEEKLNNTSAEDLRAMILAYKLSKDAPKVEKIKKEEVDPETATVNKGKKWATTSFICGLLSWLFLIVPGVNVILALIFFFVAFVGFGQCAGQRSNLALTGVILAIVAIFGAWAYNSMLAPSIGEMLGLTGSAAEQGAGTMTTVS